MVPTTSTELTPAGAAEQGAIKKTRGFIWETRDFHSLGKILHKMRGPAEVKLAQVSRRNRGVTIVTMAGMKHLPLRVISGSAEKTQGPQSRIFKSL